MKKLKVIDLFSGCGGISLGLKNAGLDVVASVDSDMHAAKVYRTNVPGTRVFCEDLKTFAPEKLESCIGDIKIDIIAGGPPCQGFSIMKQLGGSNHGTRFVEDERRYLYKEFLKYVEFFRPKVFVMENVRGIKTAENGAVFKGIIADAESIGYKVDGKVLNVWEFGVPQKRIRQIFFGVRKDFPSFEIEKLIDSQKTSKQITLWEAIGDLPPLKAGESKSSYRDNRKERQIKRYGADYIEGVLEQSKAYGLTSHEARPHSERDLRDFQRLGEGETGQKALARGEYMEYPYNREIFKDRYTRQHRNRLCSTITAHLSKDGLMFIHPTQNRSLTPREAARIQSFPDWFLFPVPRTHQFRLIGNAVPPLLGKVIGNAVRRYIEILNTDGEKQIPYKIAI